MLTLAGVPLIVPTAEIHAWVTNNIDPRDICPWTYRAFPGTNLTGLAFPTGFSTPRETRLNRFAWPRGASRWAYGHFLASTNQVKVIRDVAFGEVGDSTETVILEMGTEGQRSDEGTEVEGVQLHVDVYLLPPYPLGRVDPVNGESVNGLYLLTVVDKRYYWWHKPTPDFAIDGTSTTWESVFEKIGDAIGEDIEVDPIHADYLKPHKALNLKNEALPLVLDAVAYNCGQRVIVDYDGKVKSINAGTGKTRRSEDDETYRLRTIRAGGDRFKDRL